MEMRGPEKWLLSSPAWAAFTSRVVVPRLWADADLPDRAEVLQVGCGAGGETEGLAGRFAHWGITATDYDPDMVVRAGQRLAFLGERVHATDLPTRTVRSISPWRSMSGTTSVTGERPPPRHTACCGRVAGCCWPTSSSRPGWRAGFPGWRSRAPTPWPKYARRCRRAASRRTCGPAGVACGTGRWLAADDQRLDPPAPGQRPPPRVAVVAQEDDAPGHLP